MTGGAECFVAEGIECFVTGVAECSVPGGTEHFVGTSLVVLSACCCPNLPHVLLHSCKWGNAVPMNIFCNLLGHYHCMGDHCYLGWGICF